MSYSTKVKKEDYLISIKLDNRRKKQSGKYPVKLRVYGKNTQKEKWYSLGIDLTEKEFTNIWLDSKNKKLRGNNKEIRLKLQLIESRANEEAKKLITFDFNRFETKLFRKSSDRNSIKYYFDKIITDKTKNNKIGTAESYKYTLNSIKEFSETEKNCKIEKLTFEKIDVNWLKQYENYMKSKSKSFTTIAIYTRTLRAVFNYAIENNDINNELYPFGKNKYKIPTTKKVKKALNSEQLNTLFNAKTLNDNEAKSMAFWFFSYACYGMNLKDIALLKYSDIQEDKFLYYRAKTFDKTAEKTAITIYLTDFTESIIKKYGNKNKDGFVFDIINSNDNSLIQYKKIKNFTRYINDHIKRIAKRNDLPSDISTYWARHSFATNSIRKGASMEFISEALNHSDLNVTKNYFAGFEDTTKKEFSNSIMNF
ncbi:site-specific integrase [Winogradskyella psychrotolerans]|uniref:tyrosine-type recombinase/integrase n=1 Tax=Winogradskyella psychrotolerans TaxID=1344585 RepID=UPI001C06D70A|nr:site-specific integrase [Winogradskyella psychrotolerans]MBU2921489.1 site-specific integrase [Winogradskyella psychrotolerans]